MAIFLDITLPMKSVFFWQQILLNALKDGNSKS